MLMPKVGCVQLNSQQDIDANLNIVISAIANASRLGVSLLVLPENMLNMGKQSQLSERFDELSAILASLAQRHNIHIVAGTLPCPYRPDGTLVPRGLLRQVSQLFDPSGKRLARYDKIHLFKAEVGDNKGSYDEGRTFEAGDKLVVAPCDLQGATDIVNVGMMVCFDLRFAQQAQRLRSFGADILTAPSAFTYPTGQAHWQLLLQARALDAQCMLIGSAQGGTHYYTDYDSNTDDNSDEDKPRVKHTRRTWGHAMITNGNGEVVVKYNHDTISEHHHTLNSSSKDDTNELFIGSNYVLLTTQYHHEQQHQWRQNLPIARCHRLG